MNHRGYWTKEKCQEESFKYNTRSEFQRKCTSSYIASRKNGWLNEICSHMTEIIKPDGYWTKEKCQEEALKYKTRSDYSKNSSYQQSISRGWLDEICTHMKVIGDKYKRCIYVYEFSDRSAYVGLTYNIDVRHSNHISNLGSSVYKKVVENIKYEMKQLTDYVSIEEAKNLENYYVKVYMKNNWNILNKNRTGGVGGKFIKWTKEKCQEESLKYRTRSEQKKYNETVYNLILKNGWTDEMFSHMVLLQNPNGHWTKERCQEESLKYTSRKNFKKYSKAYSPSCKKGWLDDICSHMKKEIYGNE